MNAGSGATCRRYVHFRADGVYFTPRMDEDRQCRLVIFGAGEWSNKDVLGLTRGFRESSQSWRELDLKRRGLVAAPKLAVGDGVLGRAAAGLRQDPAAALPGPQWRA